MSDSLNNKELVAVGHHLAKALSTDTPIIDIAKILSRLAERLDCTAAALREMTKQRDAEHTDVLVWEKTMFKVCGEDGPKSVADKFAELEAKCAALAAELQAVKNYRPQPGGAIMMKALDAFEAQDDYPEGGMMDAFEILCCKGVETPDTDTFLAEVRAQGVEMFAASERELAARHANTIDTSLIEYGAARADDFAAQVRQRGAA